MQRIAHILTSINFLGLVCAAVYVIFYKGCEKEVQVNTVHTERTVIYDSTRREIPVLNPPSAVSVFTVPVPSLVDTAEVLRRYFAAYTYTQIIQDSCLRASIWDSVSQNRILARRFNYQWLKPVKTVESTTVTVLEPPKPKLYAGLFVDFGRQAYGVGPRLTYQPKGMWQFSYDLELLQRRHRVCASRTLNFK